MKSKARYYFPGSNTPKGFVSYYGDILSQREAAKIICIKGGPGTGKSTFMKQIGKYYLDKGFDIDFLKCSSDPASLDGIVLRESKVAIIDGTNPHVIDPIDPGAVDEILDFGVLLDEEKLRKNKEDIILLTEVISETFGYAYGYLKCADILSRQSCNIIKKYINTDKLMEFIIGIKIPTKGSRSGIKKRYFGSSITSAGIVNEFDSISKNISNIFLIDIPDGYKNCEYMNFLSQRIMLQGYDVDELYCPMSPLEMPEHIISIDANLAVFTCNRFHSKELFEARNVKETIEVDLLELSYLDRLRVDELRKAIDDNIEKAKSILKTAKELHDDLEHHYIDAMDFKALNEIQKNVVKKIDELVV